MELSGNFGWNEEKGSTSFDSQMKLPWQPVNDSLLSYLLSYTAKAYPTFAFLKLSSKGSEYKRKNNSQSFGQQRGGRETSVRHLSAV